MLFFSVFFALVLDHFRPVRINNPILKTIRMLADRFEIWFNAGHPQHGRIGWMLLVFGITPPVLVIYWACFSVSAFLAMLFNILILYLCMGFMDYSQYFSSIQIALISGDEAKGRRVLSQWSGQDTSAMETPEIMRLSIERALMTSHQHVFGVFFWFMIPGLGPAGAVLYRLAAYLVRAWSETGDARYEAFGRFAARAFLWIDWIPSRLTAICFAVVGNFEDAVYAWRNFADRWDNGNTGVLLSAGGGALGVRLGTPYEKALRIVPVDVNAMDMEGLEAESQPGEEPSIRFFQLTTGLIWRALLLWLLLFLFFTIVIWLL
ncbi:MAG: CobD/CbiB family protein [Burkholderiaceae bacterium]|jgi:adenosylcobinamide-phosphate synthase|nr:CobD/CbiB family protein [Burkholderiaceae bacterium]